MFRDYFELVRTQSGLIVPARKKELGPDLAESKEVGLVRTQSGLLVPPRRRGTVKQVQAGNGLVRTQSGQLVPPRQKHQLGSTTSIGSSRSLVTKKKSETRLRVKEELSNSICNAKKWNRVSVAESDRFHSALDLGNQ